MQTSQLAASLDEYAHAQRPDDIKPTSYACSSPTEKRAELFDTDETGAKMKWDAFWRYFRTTWMESYGSDLWNVNSMIKAGVDVQNRTNNRLERYNRAFGELFAVKHPSFVETTKTDARKYVQLIDDEKISPTHLRCQVQPPLISTPCSSSRITDPYWLY